MCAKATFSRIMLISRQTAKFVAARAMLFSACREFKLSASKPGQICLTWVERQASIWKAWTRLDRDLVSARLHSLIKILRPKTTLDGRLAALVSVNSSPRLFLVPH
jgi:hypothetical protein